MWGKRELEQKRLRLYLYGLGYYFVVFGIRVFYFQVNLQPCLHVSLWFGPSPNLFGPSRSGPKFALRRSFFRVRLEASLSRTTILSSAS